MASHHTGYDMHDIHILWKRENKRKNNAPVYGVIRVDFQRPKRGDRASSGNRSPEASGKIVSQLCSTIHSYKTTIHSYKTGWKQFDVETSKSKSETPKWKRAKKRKNKQELENNTYKRIRIFRRFSARGGLAQRCAVFQLLIQTRPTTTNGYECTYLWNKHADPVPWQCNNNPYISRTHDTRVTCFISIRPCCKGHASHHACL